MEIGWDLEAHGGPGRRVHDDPVKRGKRLIPGQWIFPRLKFRMANTRVDQIHLADVAFVLLKRGDLPGIRRPSHDWTVAPCPAGVVGGVAEILDAVRHWATVEGVFAAPEGAASLVAYQKLRASRFFHADDTVVLFNTGTAYKYLDMMESKRRTVRPEPPTSRIIGGIIGPF